MSANKTNPELPRMVCPHCYLSTRADMPKCLYCGTNLHPPRKGGTAPKKSELAPHAEMSHRARATLSRWR